MIIKHFKHIAIGLPVPFNWKWLYRLTNSIHVTGNVTFGKDYFIGGEDQDDWNKIIGFSGHFLSSRKDSYMVVGRVNRKGQRQLGLYVHDMDKRSPENKYGVVLPDSWGALVTSDSGYFEFSLSQVSARSVTCIINGEKFVYLRHKTTFPRWNGLRRVIMAWFGGTKTANWSYELNFKFY